MATYVGIEPLTIARTVTGTAVYVYANQPVVGLDPEDAARLVEEGFLHEVETDADGIPQAVPVADDPGTGTAIGEGSAPATVRPKNTAPKADWLTFRGVPAEDADRFTLPELRDDELMDDWTQVGEVEHADGTRSATLRDAVDRPGTGDIDGPAGIASPDAS